jgi:hypothetical protein
MIGGMFLVDLRDGSTTTVPRANGDRGMGMATFDWSPDSDELVLVLTGQSTRVSVPGLELKPFRRTSKNYPTVYVVVSILDNGGWVECPYRRNTLTECNTYGPHGGLVATRSIPQDLRRWGGPSDEVGGAVFYSVPRGSYGNHRHDWEVLRTDADFQADARLVLPARSEINGVVDAFDSRTLGLAAIDDRQLLAWLVDEHEIVRVIRPGGGAGYGAVGGQDWWDVSFARDLARIR